MAKEKLEAGYASLQRREANTFNAPRVETQHRPLLGSGSMRGNDVAGNNGSYSQGTYASPPGEAGTLQRGRSYSDFINFNYGPEQQRYYRHQDKEER